MLRGKQEIFIGETGKIIYGFEYMCIHHKFYWQIHLESNHPQRTACQKRFSDDDSSGFVDNKSGIYDGISLPEKIMS